MKMKLDSTLSKDYHKQVCPHKSCGFATAGEWGASEGLESVQGKNDWRGGGTSEFKAIPS